MWLLFVYISDVSKLSLSVSFVNVTSKPIAELPKELLRAVGVRIARKGTASSPTLPVGAPRSKL